MRRKTIQDITVAEMKKMRASGMTNQEIAASLEISYQSVLRHIGPQPSEYRGTSARWATTKPEHASGAPAAEKPDKPRFAVRVTKETIEHSEDGIDPITATVDKVTRDVSIETYGGVLVIPFDAMPVLAQFCVTLAGRCRDE